MSFSINDIRSAINSYGGVARSNRFEVNITPPPFINSRVSSDLRFFAAGAVVPAFGLQTGEIMHNGFGVLEKRPVMPIFEDAQLTFICDEDGAVIDFFREWVTYINPFMVDGGNERDTFAFPADYSTVIDITTFKTDGEETLTYSLQQAYPISIGSVPINWQDQNTLMLLPVNIAFHSWLFRRN